MKQAREVHRLVRQLTDEGARAVALEITARIVDYHADVSAVMGVIHGPTSRAGCRYTVRRNG